ncbi:MAG: hypothetical protein HQK77_07825, partial [Desulfobacterales bacterium]|nr:hypothetical protein [Desulfobacterales bacterium]
TQQLNNSTTQQLNNSTTQAGFFIKSGLPAIREMPFHSLNLDSHDSMIGMIIIVLNKITGCNGLIIRQIS